MKRKDSPTNEERGWRCCTDAPLSEAFAFPLAFAVMLLSPCSSSFLSESLLEKTQVISAQLGEVDQLRETVRIYAKFGVFFSLSLIYGKIHPQDSRHSCDMRCKDSCTRGLMGCVCIHVWIHVYARSASNSSILKLFHFDCTEMVTPQMRVQKECHY
jgi:hypothetical protein